MFYRGGTSEESASEHVCLSCTTPDTTEGAVPDDTEAARTKDSEQGTDVLECCGECCKTDWKPLKKSQARTAG